MVSNFPVLIGRITGTGKRDKKTSPAYAGLYSGGEKVIGSNKGIIKLGRG